MDKPVSISDADLLIKSKENDRLNKAENILAILAQGSPHQCTLTHRFTPGMYSREILMPAGTLLTSKIHKTEHQYVVTEGIAHVWTEETGVLTIKAPYVGITKPGTRRMLYIEQDCRWITFHPTTETDIQKIEEELIYPHPIPMPTAINNGAKS